MCGCCGASHRSYYGKKMQRVRNLSSGEMRIYLEVEIRRVQCRRWGKVKREELEWLSRNPFYTKRFAFFVGRKCRPMAIQDVAKELKLESLLGSYGVTSRRHRQDVFSKTGKSLFKNIPPGCLRLIIHSVLNNAA
ncbi:MAG: transposase family protein [Candidatus Brocadia sp.]|nr:transposase family protein [Candidatus Brocadia sp.]